MLDNRESSGTSSNLHLLKDLLRHTSITVIMYVLSYQAEQVVAFCVKLTSRLYYLAKSPLQFLKLYPAEDRADPSFILSTWP